MTLRIKQLSIFALAAACFAIAASVSAETRSPKRDIESNINTFSAIVKELQTNYVDTINMDEVVKAGIDAMLYKLDPYTEYFPLKEQQEFRSINAGEYAGIGSYISSYNNAVWITGPHEGSPAAKAGLRSGDKLLMIDTTDVSGMASDKVSDMLKGSRGSTVKVKVWRPYTPDSIRTFEIVRDKISIPAVPYYGVTANDLGYIQLGQFSEKSADEFKAALEDLMDNHKIKGLVIDLRDNGGGYLESAVKILSYFLPKGTEVLRTRGRGVLDEKVYKTTAKPIAPKLPLVVLTNGSTASASEITAGALQDLDRAVVMGNRSFGKGLVQSTFGLPYDGMVKITVAKYYIPSGRLIQAIDYSNRNADGAATRIADSLTHEFATANGRVVRDGGGITPDVEIEYPDISRVTYNVVADRWAFDFATKYAAEHPSIAPAGEFSVDDSIYADFKRFIDPEKFNHDRVCDLTLDQLRKVAKVEGYMTDSLEKQIAALGEMMHQPLDKDLDTQREAITPYLEREIVGRYYFTRGEVENFLRHDKALREAEGLLNDPQRYAKLLAAPSSK